MRQFHCVATENVNGEAAITDIETHSSSYQNMWATIVDKGYQGRIEIFRVSIPKRGRRVVYGRYKRSWRIRTSVPIRLLSKLFLDACVACGQLNHRSIAGLQICAIIFLNPFCDDYLTYSPPPVTKGIPIIFDDIRMRFAVAVRKQQQNAEE